MTYLSEAHARFLHGLTENKPVAIPLSPSASDFADQAKHIREAGRLFLDYLQSVATDGRENLSTGTIGRDFESYVQDAVSELAGDFETAAEELRLTDREFSADRSGWAKAHALGVD